MEAEPPRKGLICALLMQGSSVLASTKYYPYHFRQPLEDTAEVSDAAGGELMNAATYICAVWKASSLQPWAKHCLLHKGTIESIRQIFLKHQIQKPLLLIQEMAESHWYRGCTFPRAGTAIICAEDLDVSDILTAGIVMAMKVVEEVTFHCFLLFRLIDGIERTQSKQRLITCSPPIREYLDHVWDYCSAESLA